MRVNLRDIQLAVEQTTNVLYCHTIEYYSYTLGIMMEFATVEGHVILN